MKPQLNVSELGSGANHRQQLTGQFANNRKAVLWLCSITEQQYTDFMISTLADWVDWMLPSLRGNSKPSLNLIEGKLIGNWWQFNWNNADHTWILSKLYAAPAADCYYMYRQCHQLIFNTSTDQFRYLSEDFAMLLPDFEKEAAALLNTSTTKP